MIQRADCPPDHPTFLANSVNQKLEPEDVSPPGEAVLPGESAVDGQRPAAGERHFVVGDLEGERPVAALGGWSHSTRTRRRDDGE